jgi:hypothetical protein
MTRTWLDMWLTDLTTQRDGETEDEHLERIKAALTIELDEDI